MEKGYSLKTRWHRHDSDDSYLPGLCKWDYSAYEDDKGVQPERFVIRAPRSEQDMWLLRDAVSGEECRCTSFAECRNAADRYAEKTARRHRSDYRLMAEAYTAFGDRVMIESISPGGACCFRYLDGKYRGRIGHADSPCELYLQEVFPPGSSVSCRKS